VESTFVRVSSMATVGIELAMRDSPLDKPVTITAYQDGPYLIRGPFRLTDQNGGEIDLERRTIALCRCGRSRIRPFCDGTHRSIGFRAPSRPEEPLSGPGDEAGEGPGR
jgi:CDGSH-type Zn-finger protein